MLGRFQVLLLAASCEKTKRVEQRFTDELPARLLAARELDAMSYAPLTLDKAQEVLLKILDAEGRAGTITWIRPSSILRRKDGQLFFPKIPDQHGMTQTVCADYQKALAGGIDLTLVCVGTYSGRHYCYLESDKYADSFEVGAPESMVNFRLRGSEKTPKQLRWWHELIFDLEPLLSET